MFILFLTQCIHGIDLRRAACRSHDDKSGVLQQLTEGEFEVVHDRPSSFATRMPHFGTRLTVSKSSSNATVRRPFIERIDRLWERPVPYVGRTNGATWFFSGFTNCRRSPKA